MKNFYQFHDSYCVLCEKQGFHSDHCINAHYQECKCTLESYCEDCGGSSEFDNKYYDVRSCTCKGK